MRLENIEAIIAKGESTEEELKKYLAEYFLEKNEKHFYTKQREEYNLIYPTNEDITYEQYRDEKVVVTEAEEQIIVLKRPYTPTDVSELVNNYLLNSNEYLLKQEKEKLSKLEAIITPTKEFHGDSISRVDLLTLLVLRLSSVIPVDEPIPVEWKTKNGIVDNLTYGDIINATFESLDEKAKIIGVEQ